MAFFDNLWSTLLKSDEENCSSVGVLNQIVADDKWIIVIGKHMWHSVDESLENLPDRHESRRLATKLKVFKINRNVCLLGVHGIS